MPDLASQLEFWRRLEARSYWLLLVISFLAVALWESRRARFELTVSAERRWSRHGILMLLYSVTWMAVYRAGPVVVAIQFADSRFGLLNKAVLPYAVRFTLTIVALDFVRYAALIERLSQPLIATSANISGQPTCTSGIEVFGTMDGRIDLVLDAGHISGAGATTIDVTEPYWKIIREGAILEKEIAEVLKGT